jgi:hypothetical protein
MSLTPKKLQLKIICRVCGKFHRQPSQCCTDCSGRVEGKVVRKHPLTIIFWEKEKPANSWEVVLASGRLP